MKPDVLIATPMLPHTVAALDATYRTHHLPRAADPAALLREAGPHVRAVATANRADAALIDALPGLEIIASFGVGYDGVDVGHARRRGVVVTNTPGVLDDEVANTGIALILATTRRIVAYDAYVRAGRWAQEGDPPLTTGIRGKTVGIVGLGRIGRAIAEKLAVFGPEIVYHARRERTDAPYAYFADLEEMARHSDVLVVITPGGEETRHLVNAKVIDALGPKGTLVNIARGSVVDEAALVAALLEGRLGAAGLDVFENEPHVPEALFALPNVVLQPHQGSATEETRRAMGQLVLDNLAAHFAGRPPLTPVA